MALIIKGTKATLEKINTNGPQEEILLEIPSVNTNNLKLSVSPKGTYAYLLQNNSLILFDITSKKQIDKISSAESAVWIGNGYAIYSGPGGTFIYNLKTKEKNKIGKIEQVSGLTFNPKENGIIAFNENGNTTIVNCQTWQIINMKQGAELKTLTSEKTAITRKGDQFGYWRFKNKDWGVKILEDKSKFVTVWQRY
jgi:DNA-binding beta-propeller fold protein YncE